MYYRLSNTAHRSQIEQELGIPFKFPQIYKPQALLNGLEETTLPVITMDDPSWINYSIWGILPEDYLEDWEFFQNIYNTLNLGKESLDSNLWYSAAIERRRCMVVTTGFFTTYLHKGDIYPYYVHAPDYKPFCIGGVYNQLEDGFITCALIIVQPDELVSQIQTVDRGMPLIIGEEMRKTWLDPKAPSENIVEMIRDPGGYRLNAHPIAKEFYKNNISYNSMLDPVLYKGIPHLL
ncbi:SOS response-associated peptidase family protein [Zeaxanthinibacter sp. PT1]|uniref:SOS response-associated peptidase n=1 Tax=Zeaxanthinibacter TaxID=561554 RepID=UPI00234973FC|nr:SOS response-associated peptidase family protein [Zeaxanthinibacter sp. PT1]MDC6351152.1 SOS response-associated peptidase family protein [Zeaxanthinibacter sp. PT1]